MLLFALWRDRGAAGTAVLVVMTFVAPLVLLTLAEQQLTRVYRGRAALPPHDFDPATSVTLTGAGGIGTIVRGTLPFVRITIDADRLRVRPRLPRLARTSGFEPVDVARDEVTRVTVDRLGRLRLEGRDPYLRYLVFDGSAARLAGAFERFGWPLVGS